MTDWQPIETAPKDGTRVLLIGKNGANRWMRPFVGYWTPRYAWSLDVYDFESVLTNYHPPTHWMPLPPTPTAAK